MTYSTCCDKPCCAVECIPPVNDDQQFLELLGLIYLEYGKFAKAKVLLQATADLGGASPRIYNAIAYCALSLQDDKLGQLALEQAESHPEKSPTDQRFSQYLRSRFLMRQGDLIAAQNAFAHSYPTKP